MGDQNDVPPRMYAPPAANYYVRESAADPQLGWPAECLLDASLIVVWAYVLVFRDPAARAQLMSQIQRWTVNGGYLMRLAIPLRFPNGEMRPPALPNFLDLYLQQLEQILSHRRVRERLGGGVGVPRTAPQSASDSE